MGRMIEIAPSILSADFTNLGQEVSKILDAGVRYIHVDVMDGKFVPNISIGSCVLDSLNKRFPQALFDVHLMIENPSMYIEDFVASGADIITFHIETVIHCDRLISYIKSCGIKVGVALVPSTDENVLRYVLEKIDLVLVMTVNPGFGGQKFLSSQLKKIMKIKNMLQDIGRDEEVIIEVDGGINDNTAKEVIDAGANLLVAGSYIFCEGNDYKERISKLIP